MRRRRPPLTKSNRYSTSSKQPRHRSRTHSLPGCSKMARPWSPDDAYACISLLLLLLLPAATATSYSSLCSFPAEAADLVVTAGEHQSIADQLNLPLPSDGYFSGGDKLLFASDDHRLPRSFSFFTRHAARTTDPAITHLVATVTLSGYRFFGGRTWRTNVSAHSVSFDLEGYYSTDPASAASAEVCMVGSGSRARDDGLGVVVIPDVALRLHLPRPATLTRPFVTGRLEGSDIGTVTLVAYAKGDYMYGEAASCPTLPGAARSAIQVFDGNFTCHRLGALLRGSYTLEYAEGRAPSSFPLRQRHRSMHISEMYCGENGAMRAYMVFDDTSSDATLLGIHNAPGRSSFQANGDEALVADGFWNPSRGRLCLKACRTVRSTVRESDCGIWIRFWFPAVWSIQQRSVVAGMIRNTRSDHDDTNKMSGAISVSRTGFRSNLYDIKYKYTRVEDAKSYYKSKPQLSKERNGRFPGNYSYRDFAFSFYMTTHGGHGYASPVTLGSAMVDGGTLTADDAFFRDSVAEMNKQRLLNVSYEFDIRLYRHVNSSWNVSRMPDRWRLSAEGVFDTKSGSLCMVGCRVINTSLDCEILVTVQFAALGGEGGAGSISSLRKKNDTLFFETLRFAEYGESAMEAVEAISRMDMERIMLVSSMTLSCVFLLMQLRHAKKNPDGLPATSITMLAVLALGYMIPLVVNYEAMFVDDSHSRSKHFIQLASGGLWLELNEFALRFSTMVAFVLQLRLLLLAWSARSTAGASGGGDELWAVEWSTLWICLPLYIAGAVLIWIPHIGDGHDQPLSQMKFAIHAPPAAQLSDDLLSYSGLILDGFLLPQIVSNAFSASRVNAISPWFYVGGTVIRAAPHAYDGLRARGYVQRWIPSYVDVYAGPRDDLFSVAWDVVIPCGVAALAILLFFQQRLGGDFLCSVKRRKPGGFELVSTSTL